MKGQIVAANARLEIARAIGRGSVTFLAVTYRAVGINSGLFVALPIPTLIQHCKEEPREMSVKKRPTSLFVLSTLVDYHQVPSTIRLRNLRHVVVVWQAVRLTVPVTR